MPNPKDTAKPQPHPGPKPGKLPPLTDAELELMATVTPQDIAETAQWVRVTLDDEWADVLDAEQEATEEV